MRIVRYSVFLLQCNHKVGNKEKRWFRLGSFGGVRGESHQDEFVK